MTCLKNFQNDEFKKMMAERDDLINQMIEVSVQPYSDYRVWKKL